MESQVVRALMPAVTVFQSGSRSHRHAPTTTRQHILTVTLTSLLLEPQRCSTRTLLRQQGNMSAQGRDQGTYLQGKSPGIWTLLPHLLLYLIHNFALQKERTSPGSRELKSLLLNEFAKSHVHSLPSIWPNKNYLLQSSAGVVRIAHARTSLAV